MWTGTLWDDVVQVLTLAGGVSFGSRPGELASLKSAPSSGSTQGTHLHIASCSARSAGSRLYLPVTAAEADAIRSAPSMFSFAAVLKRGKSSGAMPARSRLSTVRWAAVAVGRRTP